MVMNLKVFLAVLASLALVGCPDDSKDDAKVKLEIASIANFAESADIGDFKVTVKKDDKTDEESTLEITVKIVCGDKDSSKKRAAVKGVATFTKADFDIEWAKGDCKATASGEGADSVSKEFKVTEAEETTPPPSPGAKPTVDANVIGKGFKITGGTGAVNLPASGCGLKLVHYDYGSDTNVPGAIGNNKEKLFAIGTSGTGCVLKIGTDAVQKGTTDVTAFTAHTPAHAVKAVFETNKIKVNNGEASADATSVTGLRVFARDGDPATNPWARIGSTTTAADWNGTGIDKGSNDEVLVYFKTSSGGTEAHWLLHFAEGS